VSERFDVICIGAALVDMVAQVQRHPLEDDEVFVSDLKLLSGGAAANTAYACAKLELNTAFIGKLGTNDEFGNKILKDFKEVSLDTSLIKYSKDQGTGSAYVALNPKGDRRIYAHSGAANYLSEDDIIPEEILNSKIIFLSSLKNVAPFIKAATIARKNNISVILNPGMLIIEQGLKNITKLLEKIDILILSQREYRTLLKFPGDKLSERNILDRLNTLFDLGIKVLIVTMGNKGAFLANNKESELIPANEIKNVVDTTGAGDAFSAGFMTDLIGNLDYQFENLKNCVKRGNLVAGMCIQELGARNGIPTPDDMQDYLS